MIRFSSRTSAPVGMAWLFVVAALFALGEIAPLRAATLLTTLYSFSKTTGTQGTNDDGARPKAPLVQDDYGNFYGTTHQGGNGNGTVFKFTPAGALTTLHSFSVTNGNLNGDGAFPSSGLVQDTDGNFYGTTGYGGASGIGTIFKITATGTFTTLHNFSPSDGYGTSSLVEGDGNFYGTGSVGGSTRNGAFYEISPTGTLTTLYNFSQTNGGLGYNSDGSGPGGIVLGGDGNFYGAAYQGGAYGNGTVFEITPVGVLTTLYSFPATSGYPVSANVGGAHPRSNIVQGSDGNFYGTTGEGGTYGKGTVFEITPTGTLTVLHNFSATNNGINSDGAGLYTALIPSREGMLYGLAYAGGAFGDGVVYAITPAGTFTTLVNFMGANGQAPVRGLIQGTDGNFYGTTSLGGANGTGTIFELSDKAAPPTVSSFTPVSGPIGTVVMLTGTHLNGVTAVRFHDASAKVFAANAQGTQLTVTVPSGAAKGTITVSTPGGQVKTATPFTVN